MDLTRELSIAEDLAKRAGVMALKLRDQLKISHKPHGDGPVTNADIAIDQFICEELKRNFPSDNIISEEGLMPDDITIGDGRWWFVDPIDGTASYILGDDDFVVMIGLAIDGEASLGVVVQPTKDIMWCGITKPGFAQKKSAGHVDVLRSSQKMEPSKLVVIASRTHRSHKQDAMVLALKPAHILYRSSIGLKAMLIAEGCADLYVAWSRRIKLWDTCAPAAILKAAFAHVSFVDEKSLIYRGSINHNGSVIFANFKPSPSLFAMLQEIEDKNPL